MKEGRKQDERKTEAEGQRVRGIMQGLKFSMQSRTIRIGGGAHATMFVATSNNSDFYDYEIEAGAVLMQQADF